MKFMFPVSENGENGLGDEGADGGSPPRIFGLEPPMVMKVRVRACRTLCCGGKVFGLRKMLAELALRSV